MVALMKSTKKYFKDFLSLIIVFVFFNNCSYAQFQCDTLNYTTGNKLKVYCGEKKLNHRELYEAMYQDIEVYEQFIPAQNFYETSKVFAYSGLIFIIAPASIGFAKQWQDYNNISLDRTLKSNVAPFVLIGSAFCISSLFLQKAFQNKALKSISLYNQKRRNGEIKSSNFRLDLNPSNVSLNYKF